MRNCSLQQFVCEASSADPCRPTWDSFPLSIGQGLFWLPHNYSAASHWSPGRKTARYWSVRVTGPVRWSNTVVQ